MPSITDPVASNPEAPTERRERPEGWGLVGVEAVGESMAGRELDELLSLLDELVAGDGAVTSGGA